MEQQILVTYASTHGSTREIAERISTELREAGLQVDLLPVQLVSDLAPYSAVIVGSGLYVGKWLKEGEQFLRHHQRALSERPVWIFSSGPTGSGDPVQLLDGVRLPAALVPVAGSISPRDIAVFHGNIDPKKLMFIQRFAIRHVVKKPFGDYRDWESIAAWSRGVADCLIAN